MPNSKEICHVKHEGMLTEEKRAQVLKAQGDTAPTAVLSRVLRVEEHPLHSCTKALPVQ